MAKSNWSVSLDSDKKLKFSYGDKSSVTLSEVGEVINSASTQEPINAIEHLYDIPNRDLAKTTPNLLLQSQGDETFLFVTQDQLDINLEDIQDIDFGTNAVNRYLQSDGNGNYSWNDLTLAQLIDVNQTTAANLDYVLKDNADGTYSWKIVKFTDDTDVDFITNDPLTTNNLVLHSTGTGTFDFKESTVKIQNVENIIFGTTPDPETTGGLVLTSFGNGTYDFQIPTSSFLNLTDLDFLTNDPLTENNRVLTSDGAGGFGFAIPQAWFHDLTGVDFLTNDPLNISDLHLSTTGSYDANGNPIFDFRKPSFTNLLDIDFVTGGPSVTQDLVLTSKGDGSYEFTQPVREFLQLTGIDWTNATASPDLILKSDGSGSFYWDIPSGKLDDLSDVTGSIMNNYVLTVTAPNTYTFESVPRNVLDLGDVVTTVNNDPINDIGLVLTSIGSGTSTFEFQPIEITTAQITGLDLANDNAGNVLTSTGPGTYEFTTPMLAVLSDVDDTNAVTANTVLMTDADGTYSFKHIDVNHLLNIDFATAAAGFLQIADGDGTYSFIEPNFALSRDVDFVTNLPTTTQDLVLSTDGDGTYSFQAPTLTKLTDVDFANDSNGKYIQSTGSGYHFVDTHLQTLADVAIGSTSTIADMYLKSVGDGTYNFGPVNDKLVDLVDINPDSPVDAASTAGAYLYAEGDGSFAFRELVLNHVTNINATTNNPATTADLVLTSVGDDTYNFRVPTVDITNILNLDTVFNNPVGTVGLALLSDGDGTYSFGIPNINLAQIIEINSVVNNPTATPDLYLQSNGDGTYSYNALELKDSADIDWTSAPYPDRYVLTSDGDGTFSWREPTTTFDQYIDSMLDIDHNSALNPIGGAFVDGKMLATVDGRLDGVKYEWRDPGDFAMRFDNLIDTNTTSLSEAFRTPVKADRTFVNPSSTATQGMILKADGDASYSFIFPELRLMCDIDMTAQDAGLANDPLTVQGLLFQTKGDGDFAFSRELTALEIEDIKIGVDSPSEISTKTLDLILDSATGTTIVDDVLQVTSLVPTQVVFPGASTELTGDPNFTFDATLDILSLTGSAVIDDITIDSNIISTPAGVELVLDPDADNASAGTVRVQGDLVVTGTTTTVNSTTVTIADPIFTLGGDTPPALDDGLDRGIEYQWHDGTAAKIGYFGYDRDQHTFTFIPDATNNTEVFSGDLGNVAFGGGTIGEVTIGLAVDNEINTTTSNLIINSVTGETHIDDNLTVTGTSTLTDLVSIVNDIDLGTDNTDTVTFNSRVSSNIEPTSDLVSTLGISSNRWQQIFVGTVESTDALIGDVQIGIATSTTIDTAIGSGNLILDSDGGTVQIVDNVEVTGTTNLGGDVTVQSNIDLGTDATNTVTFNSTVDSNILPNADNTYDLGYVDPTNVNPPLRWNNTYTDNLEITTSGTLRTEPICTEPFAIAMAILLG